jgi:polysaccharide biosynthesis protein PelF
MRVLLVTEGSYPHKVSGVSNWSHEFINGLPQHSFVVLALTPPKRQAILYERPPNVEQLLNVSLRIERCNTREATKGERDTFMTAVNDLLEFLQRDLPRFTRGLRALALLGHEVNLWPLFEEQVLWQRVQSLLRLKLPYTPSLAEIALCVSWLQRNLTPLLRIPPKTDLVHATGNALGGVPAWLASHVYNVPLLLTEHHIALRERYLKKNHRSDLLALKRFQTSFYEMLARLLYWQADRIVSVSQFNRTWQLRFAAPRERTVIIPNGVDLDRFPNLMQQTHATPTLVWLGRIDPLKDLETLIAAFWQVRQLIPDSKLRIFGPTTNSLYLSRLQRQVLELKLESSVTFEGVASRSYEAFAKGDVVVSSSKSEGSPLSLLEAMACGKAIVATCVGGVHELLGDAGRLVPAQSPTALAGAIIDLLQHPEERFKLGQRARERAKTFTLEKMLARYGELYEDLVTPLRPREKPAFLITERATQNNIILLQDDNTLDGSGSSV